MAFDKNNYYRLDYIISNGNQKINTGTDVKPSHEHYKLKSYPIQLGERYLWYHNKYPNPYSSLSFISNTLQYTYGYQANIAVGSYSTANVWYEIEYVATSVSTSNVTVNGNLHELSFNRSIDNVGNECTLLQSFNGYTEYFEIYDQDTLIRKYTPAMRKSDNVVGFYDEVNEAFYTNTGSGSFSYGHIVYEVSAEANPTGTGTFTGTGYYTGGTSVSLEAIPNTGYGFVDWQLKGYTRLEYIESTGTQFIDTEVLYSNDLIEVEVGLSSTDTPSGTYKTLLGMYTSSSNGTPFSIWTNSGFGQNFRDDVSGTNYPYAFDGTKQTFTFTNNRRTGSAYNIFLFKANAKGGNTYNGLSELKIEYAKIKVNNTLVRDYIPVIRHSDGAIGLFDLVELKFYGNSGTGTFIGGGVYAS